MKVNPITVNREGIAQRIARDCSAIFKVAKKRQKQDLIMRQRHIIKDV